MALAVWFECTEKDTLAYFAFGMALYAAVAVICRIRRRRTERRRRAAALETHGGEPVRRMRRGPVRRRKRWLAAACALTAVAAMAVGYLGMRPRVPPEIAEFVRKYPEAQVFADEYPDEHGKVHEIDLTREVDGGGIPLFVQWDRRWGYERYGANYLGVNGCGPTCLSMVLCGLTGSAEENPLEVARFSEAQGYYYSGTGTAWELMTEGARTLGLKAEEGEISEDYIRRRLSPATPIICSMRPGDFTYTGHYIVLTGMDENGDVRVNDPNSPARSARSWSLDALVPQIKGIWRFAA